MRSPVESDLRMYPIDVSQRLANSACSLGLSVLRNARSDSMGDTLPNGKIVSIPLGKLPHGNRRYDADMGSNIEQEEREIRRAVFIRLLESEYGGSPQKFEIATGYSANMVSQLKAGVDRRGKPKSFGDKLARKLEKLAKWPRGALDNPSFSIGGQVREPTTAYRATNWPLTVSWQRFGNSTIAQ